MLDIIKLICEWLGYSLLALALLVVWITVIVIAVRELLDIYEDFRNDDIEDYT